MAARRAPHLVLVEAGAPRPDLRRLLLAVHRLVAPFDGAALGMVGFGLLLATLDIVVPLGAGWIVDAMAGEKPFVQVAWLIGAVALVVWIPHGNLIPWLLARYDAKRYRPRLVGHVTVRGYAAALAAPAPSEAAELQTIVDQGAEAVSSLASVAVRHVPSVLRAFAVLGLLAVMCPAFTPVLVLGGTLDIWITVRQTRTTEPLWRRRQERLNRQKIALLHGLADRSSFTSGTREWRVDRFADTVADRVEAETTAEVRAADYKLARDLLFNLTNAASWIAGAWYVMIGGHPLGNFLFFVAWSSRAVDLFSGLVLLQGEVMKSRRALERLVDLVGGQPSSVVHLAVPVRETQPLVDVGTLSDGEPGGAA